MTKRDDLITRVSLASVLIILAVLRTVWHSQLSGRMDSVFFALIGAAAVLVLVPIQRLKSFKAAGFEVSLDQPQVQGAISGLGLDRIQSEKLRSSLARLQDQLASIRGSRVLWIDDRPHKILAERRLLRSLGIEVVPAISSEGAEGILTIDNDFDLIVTDVQREGESYRLNDGIEIHEGVNFIVKLRKSHSDPVVRMIPVIFYAAYPSERLIRFTRPARESYPPPEIANSVADLAPKVVRFLAEARSAPIATGERKKATSARDEEAELSDWKDHVPEDMG
jgi:CheY-like chemotaxis protein